MHWNQILENYFYHLLTSQKKFKHKLMSTRFLLSTISRNELYNYQPCGQTAREALYCLRASTLLGKAGSTMC